MSAKSYLLVSALALAAAGSAFAAEGTQEFTNQTLSTKSRADVVAELHAAQKAGLIASGEVSRAPFAESTLPRARVAAEAREAQRLGVIGSGEILPVATPMQLDQIQAAGDRAVAMRTAIVR